MTIKIAHINFYGFHMDYNKFREITVEIHQHFKNNNIKQYTVENGFSNDNLDIGNFCINGIPFETALALKDKYNCNIDQVKEVLEMNDIKNFNIGDKVTIYIMNDWAQLTEAKGTVHSIEDSSITIKKYRSKTRGWVLNAGQVATIEKGWKKQVKTA